MRPRRLFGPEITPALIRGRILTRDTAGLKKGKILDDGDASQLQSADEVHVVELGATEVHEDAAALRLGRAVAGPGVELSGPHQSQVRGAARWRGLVRVAVPALVRLNRIPLTSVFTLVDGSAVEVGDDVVGAKVIPVAVPEATLARAEAVAQKAWPVVAVEPFRGLRAVVVVTERLKPRARAIFSTAVTRKLGWYGANLLGIKEITRDSRAIAAAYRESVAEGAELILFAGASSIDPLDPAYRELAAAGGRVLAQGAPTHPGSMLWLGRLGGATVLGVASCAGFGRNTSLDLMLPLVFARGTASADDLRALGHGGLIERGAGRQFPPYS